ncbi:MAG: trypsin-like peptidase domain-containing protein [Clostridia bacterium]|nr:trypsin-like peptidase domain-containing protein [Clostridia bacterium]
MHKSSLESFNKTSFSMEKENAGADVFESSINGVLEIFCKSNKFKTPEGQLKCWSGSGFVVTNDGFGVTNAHVAADDDGTPLKDGNMTVSVCGQMVGAKVIALADKNKGNGGGADLAVIKLDTMPFNCRPLPIGNYNDVRNGEQIYIIGNSLGEGTCITGGIVSDKNRKGKLMYDCATNPGNSGGPVIDSEGKVIGVHFSGKTVTASGAGFNVKNGDVTLSNINVKAQGMNYAVPSNVLLDFLGKEINYKV